MEIVNYLQTDNRWKNVDYSAKGEKTTIGKAGCGPTCMAMVLATLVDKNITPIDAAKWSLVNGYKAFKQGTYYSYFSAYANKYGINIVRSNYQDLRTMNSTVKNELLNSVIADIKNGNLYIACMGKGNWTTSGHFVLVYNIKNNVVYINDPNSVKLDRTQGNLTAFKNEVKYLFKVDVNGYLKTHQNKIVEVDDEVEKNIKIRVNFNGNSNEKEVKGIFKENTNYIKLRDLVLLGLCTSVDYDEEAKIPLINV